MFSKIIFALAMVCVVNASVLIASDDEPEIEIEVASNPKGCGLQSCERLCRKLKFPGGACINGRCKCDNFLNAEDDLETEFEENPKRCNDRACDWVCRRLNHTSGSCVDGRCKCESSLNAEKKPMDLEDLVSLTGDLETQFDASSIRCKDRVCRWLCRLNNSSGSCVDGRCKCERSFNSDKKSTDLEDWVSLAGDLETEFKSNPKRCNDRACDWVCRRLNHTGGSCVDGRCKCERSSNADEKPTNLDDLVSLAANLENEFESNPKRCNDRVCDWTCREHNHTSGSCVDGRFKCENSLNAEDAVTESNVGESFPTKACNNKKCDQLCRKKKFRGGACLGPNCYCNKFLSVHDDELSEESLPVPELSEDSTKRHCDSRACHQLCRRLKLPGGVCVNGRCKCDNFFKTEVGAVDEYSELVTRRSCNLKKCNRTCARRGYAGATCNNGWCNCYDKIPREDTSLLNDVASDENEESNDILTNEDNLTAPVQRACNTVNCNQMCHRLNYAGGWCRSGQCQCY